MNMSEQHAFAPKKPKCFLRFIKQSFDQKVKISHSFFLSLGESMLRILCSVLCYPLQTETLQTVIMGLEHLSCGKRIRLLRLCPRKFVYSSSLEIFRSCPGMIMNSQLHVYLLGFEQEDF